MFFVHLMKTGGSSFVASLRTTVGEDRMYPNRVDDDMAPAYTSIDLLRRLDADRRARIDVYCGHFPYIASQLVGEEVWTATVVRDPIARTISYLKHARRRNESFRDRSLEEIYDDPWKHPMLIRNYQSKLFSMTEDDTLETQLDVIDVDEARLAIAVAQLESVDVLGVHERYDDFVERVAKRGRWLLGPTPRLLASAGGDVPATLRDRIAEENEMDVRFYDHAVQLVAGPGD